jgi:hypothetical protein
MNGLYGIEMFNSLGQIVFSNYNNSGKKVIDCPNWMPGLYIVAIKDNKGTTIKREKVVVK